MEDDNEQPPKTVFATPLQAYQAYIDSQPQYLLISLRARMVRAWEDKPSSPHHPSSEAFDALMRRFTPEQRQYIATMLEEERRASLFDFMNYLNDQTVGGALRLVFHSMELPVEPYGETLFMDWMWRLSEAKWPAEGSDWQQEAEGNTEA